MKPQTPEVDARPHREAWSVLAGRLLSDEDAVEIAQNLALLLTELRAAAVDEHRDAPTGQQEQLR